MLNLFYFIFNPNVRKIQSLYFDELFGTIESFDWNGNGLWDWSYEPLAPVRPQGKITFEELEFDGYKLTEE